MLFVSLEQCRLELWADGPIAFQRFDIGDWDTTFEVAFDKRRRF